MIDGINFGTRYNQIRLYQALKFHLICQTVSRALVHILES